MTKISKQLLYIFTATVGIVAGSSAAQSASCDPSIQFAGLFTGNYTCSTLGTPGNTVPNLGGLTFFDSNTLLIGSAANGAAGTLQKIGVVRDANNHITGFSGPSVFFANAPYNDGGVTYGPGGVLFAARWPVNEIGQYLPGSTTPDKVVSMGSFPSSVSALGFVPTGFAGAGQMKIVSYGGGAWADVTLTPDGFGTFDMSIGSPLFSLPGGPEGFVFVKGANAGFDGTDALLLSEYGAGKIGAYDLDANGNPIIASRRDFMTGLSGAEGALIDPLTGDFLFSTFGGGNQVIVISGFLAPLPPGAVPEPATWAMMIGGFALAGASMRRRKANISFA